MMLRTALLCALLSAAAATSDPPKVPIPDFVKLECSLSQLAFQFGSQKVPSSPAALHAALNLGSCAEHTDAATLAENERILAAAPPVRGELPGAGTTLYVATTGDDSGAGTEAAPFASLHGAAAAIRKAGASGSTTVLVRAGKYYFNETLALGKADSNVHWAAYRGEKVTLSGGKLLAPDWKPYKGKIQMASVSPSDVLSAPEREYLGAPAPAPAPHNFGKPPAQWNTLHVDGVRQIRARFPNGDPQQGSGICFSKINRPGEGCDSYLQARGGLGCTFDPAGHNRMDNCTSLPDGPVGAQVSFGLNRGSSPTQGCKQCTTYGQFKYGIFTPPDGHPVYNKPLPGIGWQNNSLFSFWGSPFSRPAGVQYNASDNVPKLAKADGAVVHMFHGGLWGGWQYAVAGQTDSALEFGYGEPRPRCSSRRQRLLSDRAAGRRLPGGAGQHDLAQPLLRRERPRTSRRSVRVVLRPGRHAVLLAERHDGGGGGGGRAEGGRGAAARHDRLRQRRERRVLRRVYLHRDALHVPEPVRGALGRRLVDPSRCRLLCRGLLRGQHQ